MQSLLLNDVPRARVAVAQMQLFAISCAMLLVQLILTAILSPALTLVAIAILVLGAFASARWTRRGVQSGMAIVQTMEESAGSGFRLHAGLKAALAQGTVGSFLAEYHASLSDMTGHLVRYSRDYSAARQLAGLGAAFAAALLLFVGVRLLALPLPVLIASLILFARMAGPAQALQQTAQEVAAYSPAFAAIRRRLGELEIPALPRPHAETFQWVELRIEDAGFDHQDGLGLRPASMTLKAHEWIGISGSSGAGKTTLVDLVAGLLAPAQGRIAVDGVSLEGPLLERWRGCLAYVGQEAAVFNDSVRANLLAEGASADDGELWRALEQVGLADRVRALPEGLDENVGDRGSQLSGGERQRLVLARALLRRPNLLILDEATAALDPDSEAKVLQSLRSLEPRPAAILVAHRESSLAHCDSVISIRHEKLEKTRD
jgi:ATP-binding cassette subfamily C protein